jgi:hypothetical protein
MILAVVEVCCVRFLLQLQANFENNEKDDQFVVLALHYVPVENMVCGLHCGSR